jgi:hypothetical protein
MSRYEGEEIVSVETEQERRRNEQIAEARKKFIESVERRWLVPWN